MTTSNGALRICKGCAKRGVGAWPSGWLVLPVWAIRGGTPTIVDECVYCPDCRRTVKVRFLRESEVER